MTKFFVSPPARTEWALPPVFVADRLRADWPDADVRMIPTGSGRTVSLEYSCVVEGEAVHGSLDRPGQAFVVEASPRAATRLLVWFRGLVPDEQELIAYDEGFEDSTRVAPGAAAQELEAVFG